MKNTQSVSLFNSYLRDEKIDKNGSLSKLSTFAIYECSDLQHSQRKYSMSLKKERGEGPGVVRWFTCESSMAPGVANRAPSSMGGEGSPPSSPSSSTTEGALDSGVPSAVRNEG